MKLLMLTVLVLLLGNVLSAQNEFVIKIHETDDPDGLNPLTFSAANAENIVDNIYCRLLETNRKTFDLEPALAVERPVITELTSGKYKGGMSLTYEIHPKATWDNGTPVTANDYVFTIKAIKHQKTHAQSLRATVEFIDDIVVDESNPKKFTIYSKQPYFMAEAASGNLVHVLPEYIYDPSGALRNVPFATLKRIREYTTEMNTFSDRFNSEEYASDPKYVVGCGPYQLEEWDKGGSITLKKKSDWWGDQVSDNIHLRAYPDKIIYKIISGSTWVLSKMSMGELDIVRNVAPDKFLSAKNSGEYDHMIDFYNPTQFAYHYLGFNTRNPKLSDKRVREAIACMVNRDEIIETVFNGEAVKLNTPISPDKSYYNQSIKGIEYNAKRAKELLNKAGWKDTDGDDIVDKKINGKVVNMRLKYNYNKGNAARKKIGLLLKDELEKIGIRLDLYPIDFSDLLAVANKRTFEIIALAWVNAPGLDDLKKVWHTSAILEGGSNRVGFGSSKTDKIIDEIRVTLDEKKRKELYLAIQREIVAEHPYVFLVVPNEFIMIRKGLKYPELGPIRPGYVTRLFQRE